MVSKNNNENDKFMQTFFLGIVQAKLPEQFDVRRDMSEQLDVRRDISEQLE